MVGQLIGRDVSVRQTAMTGKKEPETPIFAVSSPFPVNQVIKWLCRYLRTLERILRVMSLITNKYQLIDRKWVDSLFLSRILLELVCSELSANNKSEIGTT